MSTVLKDKSKFHSRTYHEGQERECRYSCTVSLNLALYVGGVWGRVVVKRCAANRTVPGSIPGGVTGFFSDIFLPTVPWPWGRLSS